MTEISLGALRGALPKIDDAGAGFGKEEGEWAQLASSSGTSSGPQAQIGRPTTPPQHITDLYLDSAAMPQPIRIALPPDAPTDAVPLWRYGNSTYFHGDETARQAFDDARVFAAGRGEGRKVLAINEWNAGRQVHVVGHSYAAGSQVRPETRRFISRKGGPTIERIMWTIDQSAIGTNGTRLNPAIVLFHEASHAANSENRLMLAASPMGMFKNKEEHRVITELESSFLRSLGRRPRDTHSPLFFYQSAGDVLSTQALDPGVEQILQRYEPDLTQLSALADRFGVDRLNPPPAERPRDPSRIQTGNEALGQLLYKMGSLKQELRQQSPHTWIDSQTA